MPPEQFWRMSVVEWRALVTGRFGHAVQAMGRVDLAALMRRFPDEQKTR
jgi:uncharacterized phage protein (TIGR02216 family)